MKVLIFAPNAGISLSTGGGSNFAVKQADILAELGHEVTLAGYHSLSAVDMEQIHGIPLVHRRGGAPIRLIGGLSNFAFEAARRVPVKLSPYFVLGDPRFRRWIRRTIERSQADVIWFHDDIPTFAIPCMNRARVLLYVHFPVRGREPVLLPRGGVQERADERLLGWLLRRTATKFVVPNPFDYAESVWANSSVTADIGKRLWSHRLTYVPTYVVPPPSEAGEKGVHRRILSIGAFERGKEYELLLNAFRGRAYGGVRWEIDLVGHSRDATYLAWLKRLSARTGSSARVAFHVDASRGELNAALRKSGVYVHAASFEPFGLSVIEAMSEGAIPVVRQGLFSGPWRDIVAEGEWGIGFSTSEDLFHVLSERLPENLSDLSRRARIRSEFFSRDRLKERMEGVM